MLAEKNRYLNLNSTFKFDTTDLQEQNQVVTSSSEEETTKTKWKFRILIRIILGDSTALKAKRKNWNLIFTNHYHYSKKRIYRQTKEA